MTYAADTSVPIARSRAEIDHLLRQWGCSAIAWTDDFDARIAAVRFRWSFEGGTYWCRFEIRSPPDAELALGQKRLPTKERLAALRDQAWRARHRVLLLKIKADLNAVDTGMLAAVEVFLPYIEGLDGRRIVDVAVPRLRLAAEGNADRLLEDR